MDVKTRGQRQGKNTFISVIVIRQISWQILLPQPRRWQVTVFLGIADYGLTNTELQYESILVWYGGGEKWKQWHWQANWLKQIHYQNVWWYICSASHRIVFFSFLYSQDFAYFLQWSVCMCTCKQRNDSQKHVSATTVGGGGHYVTPCAALLTCPTSLLLRHLSCPLPLMNPFFPDVSLLFLCLIWFPPHGLLSSFSSYSLPYLELVLLHPKNFFILNSNHPLPPPPPFESSLLSVIMILLMIIMIIIHLKTRLTRLTRHVASPFLSFVPPEFPLSMCSCM